MRRHFYLLRFTQACNVHGCGPEDLYTPRIEADWQSVSVEDDEQLKNTSLDCRQCHQRGTDAPVLLMRELDGPWNHTAYQRYQAGELDASLPDLADIFPDDPQTRAEIGLQSEPNATPAEALIQACGSCHNDVLDQTISRARFNIALSRMDASERQQAIARLQLPKGSEGVMPPPEARQLDPGAREALIMYLQTDTRPVADDAMLMHAATQGMAAIASMQTDP